MKYRLYILYTLGPRLSIDSQWADRSRQPIKNSSLLVPRSRSEYRGYVMHMLTMLLLIHGRCIAPINVTVTRTIQSIQFNRSNTPGSIPHRIFHVSFSFPPSHHEARLAALPFWEHPTPTDIGATLCSHISQSHCNHSPLTGRDRPCPSRSSPATSRILQTRKIYQYSFLSISPVLHTPLALYKASSACLSSNPLILNFHLISSLSTPHHALRRVKTQDLVRQGLLRPHCQ